MLEIMLPAVFPVQAPVQAQVQAPVAVLVVVNPPPAVNVPLVAAGVQQLVGQLQDLVVQQVAMEVEDNNEILKRLFLQKFGRALPEVDDVDLNMDLIDLTKDEDEMEVATSEAVVVVKTEPIDDRRRLSRLGRLRKSEVIPEKEAPLAADNVIDTNDTDMAEDKSVESSNTVEPLTADEAFEMAEQAIAESDAAIAANQMVIDKFYDV
jgi:hypothetical protein